MCYLVNSDKASNDSRGTDTDETFDNTKTIRPTKSPHQAQVALPSTSRLETKELDIEDYSDIADEEEELHLKARVADFKVLSFHQAMPRCVMLNDFLG